MNRIVLATASAGLEERVHAATGGAFMSLPLGPLPADPPHLFEQLNDAPPPKVVMLDCAENVDRALDLAALFDQLCPGISVILVSDKESEIGPAAMRAGVRDILRPTATIDDMRLVLDRAVDAAQALVQVPDWAQNVLLPGAVKLGRVISVVSAKGGVGKTTVATNLAVGLAQSARNSTVLVDLDVQFGDVASALNLEPDFTLPDAVHGPASHDTMVLKTFLTLHETGLYVICGPKTPAAADAVSGKDVGRLLESLASEFQYVVVDTAPGLSEHTLEVMDQTTDLVLVTSMDVPGVRGLRKEMDTLSDLGLFVDGRHVVLNLAESRGGLTIADVEATLGTSVDLTLYRSKAAQASVNQGVPLLQSGVRDPMTNQLRHLVSRFSPAATSAAKLRRPWSRRPRAEPTATGAEPRRAKRGWYPGVRAGAG